jgi:tRNA A58 N-methylase Trm61
MSAPAAYITPFRDILQQNARLLVQAGGNDGELARAYRKLYPATSLMVVDADAERAKHARDYADRVYMADLDTVSAAFYKQLEWADGWYFDTTLEQYQQPQRVLQQVRKVMPVDAAIIARIANRDHWEGSSTPARHAWGIADILELFTGANFRAVSGILLNPAPLPADVEATLRAQAARDGSVAEALIEAALPSHYLIKAVPA